MSLLRLTGTIYDTPEQGTAAVPIRAAGAVIHVLSPIPNQCAVMKPPSQVFCPKKLYLPYLWRIHSTRIVRSSAVI